MRISTQQLFNQGLNALLTQQSRLATTQQQISRGERILSPSDDPIGAKKILDLEQSLGLTRQYLSNGELAKNRLAVEDTTLQGALNLLQRVRELTVQANNTSLTDQDRVQIGLEIEARLDELLGLANTTDGNNEYIFAGTATLTRPFDRVSGTYVYAGNADQRELFVAPEFRVPIGDAGSDVFLKVRNGNGTFAVLDNPANTGTGIVDAGSVVDLSLWVPDTYTITFTAPGTFEVRDSGAALVTSGAYADPGAISFLGVEVGFIGVPATGDSFTVSPSVNRDIFTVLDTLATDLNTPAFDAADRTQVHNALNRALTDIDQAAENIRKMEARVGARLNAVDSELEVNTGLEVQFQEFISEVQDLDLAEAVSRLSQQQTLVEAAQLSFARIQDLSLFRFL